MSKKPLLSESQVAKWMKLANIDANATQNFLTESKKGSKVLKEMYGDKAMMPPAGARDDEMEDMDEMGGGLEDSEEMMGDEVEMGSAGDGAMDDQSSVVDLDNEEVEGDVMATLDPESLSGIKDALKDALKELGLVDELGGEEETEDEAEEMSDEMSDEGEGELEGGDESAAPPVDDEEQLDESIEDLDVLTDDEIINEVLKRVIRRLV